MKLKLSLLKWFIPSEWVKWLKGRKRLLGLVSLALWAMIYLVPETCPQYAYLAEIGRNIQAFLASIGINLDATLFNAGVGLSVVGVIDWIAKHLLTDKTVKLLKAVRL